MTRGNVHVINLVAYHVLVNEYVARLTWEGLDVATGIREGGDLALRVDDILVVAQEVTRRQQMLMERMIALGPEREQDQEEVERIIQEIDALPTAKDIISTWYRKSIQLSSNYNLTLAEHPERVAPSGFGLSGGIGKLSIEPDTTSSTFSWEWFNVKPPGKAIKIQESGEISFEVATTACGTEITRMIFGTDVSLRIMKPESAAANNPDWRILIAKGSEICWPCLIDGKKVANGFVR